MTARLLTTVKHDFYITEGGHGGESALESGDCANVLNSMKLLRDIYDTDNEILQ